MNGDSQEFRWPALFKIAQQKKTIHNINQICNYFRKTIVISISRSGLLKSCARFIIERSEKREMQHDFKSVHFECRMIIFYRKDVNSYFYIEKWTFKVMCEVYYRAKRDKKEAT